MNHDARMMVVGIVGSGRKGGNTHTLVKEALRAAEALGAKTQLVVLRDHHIEGCRGCESCRDDHRCVIQDDMQSLYPLLLRADGLILGSPVYFYNVSSRMKAFIERCYCLEVFDQQDRSCWVGVREALGGGYAVVVAVAEQADEQYLGFATEAMSKPLGDLGYRVVATVKACGLWSAREAAEDRDARARAARAGERLARIIRLRRQLAAEPPPNSW